MTKPKGGLGRGLDSLFAQAAALNPAAGVELLPLREISPDPAQPRKTFAPEALTELAESIADHGLLQPIVVRPCPEGGYRIIAGERRWRASRLAGLREVPALVKEVSEEEAMAIALVENLQREDLDPIEEAAGIRELMERCTLTQEQAARALGKSRSALANSLRLLGLPPEVLALLKEGTLTPGHAKALLALPTPAGQTAAARQMAAEGLNVRQAEALCRQLAKTPPKKAAPRLREALPAEVELSLQEVLGSEVKVAYREGQGSLTVHFYSDEQLRAFANLLGRYDPTGGA